MGERAKEIDLTGYVDARDVFGVDMYACSFGDWVYEPEGMGSGGYGVIKVYGDFDAHNLKHKGQGKLLAHPKGPGRGL